MLAFRNTVLGHHLSRDAPSNDSHANYLEASLPSLMFSNLLLQNVLANVKYQASALGRR